MYREKLFAVPKGYLPNKVGLAHSMRTIMVDWMVEIQENFELNHETLYLAVKMTDLYMSSVDVTKENAQLVGACALFIAAKFDERQPPCADDFLYICDDAYTREQLLQMEENMLKQLRFDIGMPLSYRFLRRYAKATEATMELLTLSRYILEQSLLYLDYVHERESLMAAASFALALRMNQPDADPHKLWTAKHVKYSEYTYEQLDAMVWRLNASLSATAAMTKAKTIFNKYSHEVFFKVASIAPLNPPSSE
jgi:cyclin B